MWYNKKGDSFIRKIRTEFELENITITELSPEIVDEIALMPTLPDGVIVIDLENEINTRRGRYYINDLVFKDLIHQGTEICKKEFNL